MQVMVAMSGGVDSSVAAAMMLEAGHEVVGVTMKLWGGPSDKGCCSVSDVLDARRAADAIGVDHHVFNFGDDFERHVIAPYVAEHDAGRTPNPCIECNRSIKFARLLGGPEGAFEFRPSIPRRLRCGCRSRPRPLPLCWQLVALPFGN